MPASPGRAQRRLANRIIQDQLSDNRGRVTHPVAGAACSTARQAAATSTVALLGSS